MLPFRSAAASLAILALSAAGALAGDEPAPQTFPAVLAGHAVLPAMTFAAPPADAPAMFATSGKFAGPTPARIDRPFSTMGTTGSKDAVRETGVLFPFVGQPVQGFSGIKPVGNGEYIVLTDNGFGAKANSPDAMLMVHRVKPDWQTGRVAVLNTMFLSDPDRKVPFRITTEATKERYLTGADFDIESVQPVGDHYWFGDELGPFLVEIDAVGRVLTVIDTVADGKPVRSPDNPYLTTPAAPGLVAFEARRSKGFEGMAASEDGRTLYPLLEGGLWDAAKGAPEADAQGREYLRVLEFDVASKAYTGKSWKYRLEAKGNAIGDFNLIDATRGLIIERDNSEGDAAQACQGAPKPDCFATPAKFKRVFLVDLAQADTDGFLRKIGSIDLMAIQDPDHKARRGGHDGTLSFPFVTIENVARVDADHIIVANDNNLPFSSGRAVDRQDDNEFVLLKVTELLNAK
ncbi:esterase-like activity of phytase family protein [Inquilinus limosus]|uniref:esterase-like activity of phytase family protein n=1 Tax=Inquilinus limosus TaxID=171674 RepID=UPI003F189B32